MKRKIAAAAVLVTALALPNMATSATTAPSANAGASLTVKCRSAKKELNQAKKAVNRTRKRLKKAKRSGNRPKIREARKELKKARRRLRRTNKNKRKLCKAASGNAPTSPRLNHPPYFQDPASALSHTSIDIVRSNGFVDEAEVHLTVVEAIDPDGDPLTYTWKVEENAFYSWGPGTIQPSATDPRSATWHVPASASVLACGSAGVKVSDGKTTKDIPQATGHWASAINEWWAPNQTTYFTLSPKQSSRPFATISSGIEGLCGVHIS
jgi:hypothetical protein